RGSVGPRSRERGWLLVMRNDAPTGSTTKKKKPIKHAKAMSNRTAQRLTLSRFISSFLFHDVARENCASVFIANLVSHLERRIRLNIAIQRNPFFGTRAYGSAHNHGNRQRLPFLKDQQPAPNEIHFDVRGFPRFDARSKFDRDVR